MKAVVAGRARARRPASGQVTASQPAHAASARSGAQVSGRQLIQTSRGAPIGGSPTAYAIAGLFACGVLLTLGPVVYRTVEAVQTVLVLGIFALLLVLAVLLIRAADVGALLGGAL